MSEQTSDLYVERLEAAINNPDLPWRELPEQTLKDVLYAISKVKAQAILLNVRDAEIARLRAAILEASVILNPPNAVMPADISYVLDVLDKALGESEGE